MKLARTLLEVAWFGVKGAAAIAAGLAILTMIYLATLTPGFVEDYCALEWERIEAEGVLYEQRTAAHEQLKEEAHQAHLLEMKELEEIREQWAKDTVLPPPGTLVQPSGP